jgi:PEP-CTERM motif-containing protein
MRKLVFGGLLAASFLSPAVAAADIVTLTNSGPSYGWSVGKGDWVTIAVGSSGPVTGWAGEIDWLLTSATGFQQSLVTYCVDLFDDALHTQTVSVSSDIANDLTPANSPQSTSGAGGRAAWLVNTYAADASTNNDKAAGLQIAVWDTMYATNAFSVSAPLQALNWASQYLGTVGSNTSTGVYYDAQAGAGQDQIATNTPEPASVLLMMLGMCGIFGYQYRLKRNGVVA